MARVLKNSARAFLFYGLGPHRISAPRKTLSERAVKCGGFPLVQLRDNPSTK